MSSPPLRRFRAFALLTAALGAAVLIACVERSEHTTGPRGPSLSLSSAQDPFAAVVAVQNRHTEELMAIPGVVGTATGLAADGRPAVLVLTRAPGITGIPASLEGVAVEVRVTGDFTALRGRRGPGGGDAPTNLRSQIRPVPNGVSVSRNDQCAAGTLGAALLIHGTEYGLSNNHVFARENAGSVGDPVVQPGRYDNIPKCANELDTDKIGTLSDFEPIVFTTTAKNVMDAAIAVATTDLTCTTPSDFYGSPSTTAVSAAVGMAIQKVGRTSGLTMGTVTGINVQVLVNYGSGKIARFVRQFVTSGHFSRPGDSGSLIVTDDGTNGPVGLLFAGTNSGITVGNPIDRVLTRFHATICHV